MNIFISTRLKLTLWYIVISYTMLAFFTVAVIISLDRTFEVVEQAIQQQGKGIVYDVALQQQLTSFSSAFIQRLLIFDVSIAVAAGLASYVLSGRTLRPIERVLLQQQQFAADASHELRTPLANITMEIAAYRLDHPKVSTDQKNLLDSIETETQRMSSMVAGLLSLVRATNQAAVHQPTDLLSIVQSAMSAIEPRYKQAKLKLDLSSLFHDCQPIIMGQPDELRQLVLILLENALLYSHPHTLVKIQLRPLAERLELTVNNQGPVIPAKELPKVFNRFYRGSQATAPGTGLGLAIAQTIVKSHRGSIAVASSDKHGTTFRLLLPLAQS